ncbi:MAG: hypothetical protein M1370_07870 [Bacteroidetes bacterium]|nr:hypothetical protein [Bacteroidota bacterium]MCL5026297.1 hypothetical protein [Chloroflexota bacterium]
MLYRLALAAGIISAIVLTAFLSGIGNAIASGGDAAQHSLTAAAPAPAPTPTSPALVPPVSATYPDATYGLAEERNIGAYTLRLWQNMSARKYPPSDIVTISAPGQDTIQIDPVLKLDDLTGADVIVHTFSGGAHCCFSTIIYDLGLALPSIAPRTGEGPALTKVLETRPSNCGGNLQDLDGDGVYEYVTCDDLFAYTYCCYVGSPKVQAILKYEHGEGYVPASPEFADMYAHDIAQNTRTAEGGKPGGQCDGMTRPSALSCPWSWTTCTPAGPTRRGRRCTACTPIRTSRTSEPR